MTLLSNPTRLIVRRAFAFGLLASAALAHAAATFPIPPLPPGPYAVACSNMTQDFSRLAPGEDVQAYWEGVPRADGAPRYATDLLTDPTNTLAVTVNAPANGSIFGSFAGRAIAHVVLVCHPTAPNDTRPDYALPTGRAIPHMQRGAEAPLWPDAPTRWPLLVFSHGYAGSPTSNDYVAALSVLASYGYVVAAPFHGDMRFTDLKIDDLTDFVQLVSHLSDFLALEAIRPLALSATIDLLLAHPQWRDRIDPAQIGGFGASMGGESMLLLAGAGMTKSFGLSWTPVTRDTRLKAAVGYVPFFGQFFLPAFGRDQHGLDGIDLPYMAIAGSVDTVAPITETIQGMSRLGGPRAMVVLNGVKHGFDVESTNDIFTWAVTFLDAQVRNDPIARARLQRASNVAGGGDDWVLIPYEVTAPPNYGGLWWNAPAGSESGWGLNFSHQGDTLFATWFTYDLDGAPLWMVVAALRGADGSYTGTLYRASGPPFNVVPFDASKVTGTAVGTATFAFTAGDTGTFSSTIGGATLTRNIVRQTFATPVPVCTWGAQPDLALADNYQDLWWSAPAGSESGWGLNLTHQGERIFGTWFTYGFDGRPLWLAVGMAPSGMRTWSGTLYSGTGPAYNAMPFDPKQVAALPRGTATLTFTDGNHANFAYSVDGIAQSKPITREVFAAPGTVCE
jgi:predicted dienelactone hydrolase